MFEHARLTRTSLITVDNDAKSCYDRIIKAMALLACMAIGLPAEAAAMHNKVHDNMTHNIKTRHRLLRAYCGTDDGGSDGVGQGSGAAGAIWLVYSNSLITALAEFSPGVILVSPTNRLLRVCLVAIFFVDDGTPGVNDADEESARPRHELIHQAQQMAQSWERLLFASHASQRKETHEFTWAETLNEAADNLATAARDTTRRADDDKYHWPEQQVSVRGDCGQLRGNLAKELRYCCTHRDLETYYQSRYEWSDQTLDSIDMDATKGAIAKLNESGKRRIQKLRCGWLPTNYRLHMIQSECEDVSPHCSACAPETPETIDHVLQCISNERRQATQAQFLELRDKLSEWNTSEYVTNAMITGATHWMRGEDIPDVGELQIPDCAVGLMVKRAYTEQACIGWHTFLRGFWSTSWGQAHEAHIHAQDATDQREQHVSRWLTGETWAAKTQHWVFLYFETIWKIRNRQEHGGDEATQRRISLEKCERRIREMYAQNAALPKGEKLHAFKDPVDTLLQTTLQEQEIWITLTTPILMASMRRVAMLPPGQQLLSNYFVRPQPIPKQKEGIG